MASMETAKKESTYLICFIQTQALLVVSVFVCIVKEAFKIIIFLLIKVPLFWFHSKGVIKEGSFFFYKCCTVLHLDTNLHVLTLYFRSLPVVHIFFVEPCVQKKGTCIIFLFLEVYSIL